MYENFFGLASNPFAMTPDPRFLYFTTQCREALAGLAYAVLSRKGFVALTGEAGTGKTTLIRSMMASLSDNQANFACILTPTVTAAEFLEMALLDFGIDPGSDSKPRRIVALQNLLLQGHRNHKVSVLIVDEAHKLDPSVLEEIRLLSNFETGEGKLLQIVLAGQPELHTLLEREDLRQVKQRIAIRLSVGPLPECEVEHYLRHRWMRAGAETDIPFEKPAVTLIAALSGGIPRTINAICDNALLLAFAEFSHTVTEAHIDHVAGDLYLRKPTAIRTSLPAAAPPPTSFRIPAPDGAANLDFGGLRTLERYTPEVRAKRWFGKLRAIQPGIGDA